MAANSGEDDTTVVEPEQGNGMLPHTWSLLRIELRIDCSLVTYHLATAARCRFESGRAADVHFGTAEYARANHEVRF